MGEIAAVDDPRLGMAEEGNALGFSPVIVLVGSCVDPLEAFTGGTVGDVWSADVSANQRKVIAPCFRATIEQTYDWESQVLPMQIPDGYLGDL